MIYPAMTYIGSNTFSALYGQNDTIIDQKATGLQHLYIENYEKDLIHTACSVVKFNDTLYYADRVKPKIGHPKRHASSKSFVQNHCVMVDVFEYETFDKTDYVGAYEDYILFKTTLKNKTNIKQSFTLAGLAITKPQNHTIWDLDSNHLKLTIEGKSIALLSSTFDQAHLSLDAPSGFMYHGFDDVLYEQNTYTVSQGETNYPLACSLAHDIILEANETYSFEWAILIGTNQRSLEEQMNQFAFSNSYQMIYNYWDHYLNTIKEPLQNKEAVKTKLVALKGALLDGLLPADLTGHYFVKGQVSFYSRDALMGSRAFLYSGLYEDFEAIIQFFLQCEVKENGEYYQRYRFDKIGDEGANNDVFKQIDFIGYFCRVISDYYHLSNKLLVTFKQLDDVINILNTIDTKHGLYGPEGGVNEGVYGPAFILSTNMFICGGLAGAVQLAKEFHETKYYQKWDTVYNELFSAIENQFSEEHYFYYGYVTYHNQVIRRYDTPQLFGASLGYPLTEAYKKTYNTLVKHATYFEDGIGYSEQEYHDGPWIFNTAATAQSAYLLSDFSRYKKIMTWMINHQNGFGLNPEAIDAKNEAISFINPLMWANSEFVCAAYAHEIKRLRSL